MPFAHLRGCLWFCDAFGCPDLYKALPMSATSPSLQVTCGSALCMLYIESQMMRYQWIPLARLWHQRLAQACFFPLPFAVSSKLFLAFDLTAFQISADFSAGHTGSPSTPMSVEAGKASTQAEPSRKFVQIRYLESGAEVPMSPQTTEDGLHFNWGCAFRKKENKKQLGTRPHRTARSQIPAWLPAWLPACGLTRACKQKCAALGTQAC